MIGGNWVRGIKKLGAEIDQNHTMAFAAALSYYFLLSLFPALVAMSAVVGFLPVSDIYGRVMSFIASQIPADSMGVVRHILQDVATPHRGALLSLGLVGSLWTASSGFSQMIEALNVAYGVPETRPYWKTRGLAVLLTFMSGGLLLVSLILMLVGPSFGEWLTGVLHVSFLWAQIWPILRWVVSAAFIVTSVEFVYFLAPNVKQRFIHTLGGAVFATAAGLALSFALGIYFQRFADLNLTYGALGGVIALMIWLNWSSFMILLGAKINSKVLQASGDGSLRLKQTPPEKVKPQQPDEGIAA